MNFKNSNLTLQFQISSLWLLWIEQEVNQGNWTSNLEGEDKDYYLLFYINNTVFILIDYPEVKKKVILTISSE